MNYLKDLFAFSKSERAGLISLCAIIVVIAILPYTIPFFSKPNIELLTLIQSLDSVTVINANEVVNQSPQTVNATKPAKPTYNKEIELFAFNPNKLPKEQWLLLGISEKTAQTIKNYESKGGSFKSKEDLLKIYGFNQNDFNRLEPYINIPNQQNFRALAEHNDEIQPAKANKKTPPSKNNETLTIDVNQADTTQFKMLKGIGSVLAARIVKFRNKLGGFHSVNQIAEVYGIKPEVFEKIKPQLVCKAHPPKKLNINMASVIQLKAHPYINYKTANALFNYKQQHGQYKAINDVLKVHLVDEDLYQKLLPYLSIEDEQRQLTAEN